MRSTGRIRSSSPKISAILDITTTRLTATDRMDLIRSTACAGRARRGMSDTVRGIIEGRAVRFETSVSGPARVSTTRNAAIPTASRSCSFTGGPTRGSRSVGSCRFCRRAFAPWPSTTRVRRLRSSGIRVCDSRNGGRRHRLFRCPPDRPRDAGRPFVRQLVAGRQRSRNRSGLPLWR